MRGRVSESTGAAVCRTSSHLLVIGRTAIAILAAVAISTFVLVGAGDAVAKTSGTGDKTRTIYVIGDSLGGSLWIGVYHHFRGRKDVDVKRYSKISSGMVRYDFYDWQKAAEKLAAKEFEIVVMMIGGNDGQPIRVEGQRYREKVGTDLWKKTYGERVEALIRTFQETGKRFYWVGMPVQSNAKDDEVGKIINEIFREKCETLKARYIDSYTLFADKNGKYVTHLEDRDGVRRLMRDKDGMHFTTAGVKLLGTVVAEAIAADDAAQADIAQPATAEAAGTAQAQTAEAPASGRASQEEAAAGTAPEQGGASSSSN